LNPAIKGGAEMKLLQNPDAPGQLFIIESVVPLAGEILVRHALEANALDQEKFHQERRGLVVLSRHKFGFMAPY
jgi:hypothetical protein